MHAVMRTSTWLTLGLVATMSAALVACGGDDGETSSSSSSSSSSGGNGGTGGTGGGVTTDCGNGVLEGNEPCDDGNTAGGDGCDSACFVESGFTCMGEPSVCTTTCGDGAIGGDEECDDSNADANDGCDATCQEETGYDCTGEPSTCAPVCGDGVILSPEVCDDGNTAADDGCSAACTEESGFDCMGEPSTCTTTCGDGLVAGTETCDDGAAVALDGCDDMCQTETGYDCMGEPSTCAPICGDGMIIAPEICDDGNTGTMDGCDAACMVELGWTCAGMPSTCAQTCGDGVLDMGEQCDDGNMMAGDRCDAACALEFTVLDMEPNDDTLTAQAVMGGDIVVGSITANDFDVFELTLANDSFVLLEVYTTLDADLMNYNGNGALGVGDCPLFGGTDPDLHLFDAMGDVTNVTTSLFSDDSDAVNFCPYIGPNQDASFLVAGTYYIRVDGFNAANPVPQYALDVRVEAAIAQGMACDPNVDLCDTTTLLACDGTTNTCESSCGDGNVDAGEECDDSNIVDTDRCSNSCLLNATVFDTEVNDAFANAQTVVDGDILKGSTDPANGDAWDVYTFTVAADTWVVLDQYTSVDGDLTNNDSAGAAQIPELDCNDLFGGTDPDLHLFDATGDPTMDGTSLVSDDTGGDNFCAFIGPQTDGAATLLSAGTYYVKVDGFNASNPVPQYAVDLQLLAALNASDPCNPALDLCNANAGLACDGTSMVCVAPPPPSIDRANWEQFSSGQLDLANTTLTFTPQGGTYGVVASAAAAYPDAPGTGTIASIADLNLTDDGNSQQTFTMSFPFFGTNQSDVFVNANGNLTFGTSDGDFSESVSEHFDTPRIAGLWDDLDSNDAGSGPIAYDEFADRVVVTYDGVTKNSSANTIEMQIAIFDTGVVTITYLNATTLEGLVGISAGDNHGNPPAEMDFSAQVPVAPSVAGDLTINEFLADPFPGVDANCDTTFSSTQDEFVELVNTSGVPLLLSGVTLSDPVQVRHTFGSVTLPAGLSIVVYGGGTSMCPDVTAELASSGSLGLNNGGDTITLSTGASVVFGSATDSISLTRDPDITGSFVDHSAASGSAGATHSPGFRVTGESF
jgi:cysteine-rich repeat protein